VTSAGRFGTGFLVGALLAGVALLALPPSESSSTAAATATPAPPTTRSAIEEPFLVPGEVLIGGTVLLPGALELEDGVARLQYDLAGLSPSLQAHEESEYQGDVLAIPEIWRLTTDSGAVVEETTSPRDHSVRFDLPSIDDTVATVELVGWRVATPFGERIELPIEEGAKGSFRSGEAVIETVLVQRTSTIVQIDFDRAGDDWQSGVLRPLEPGWRISGRQDGGIQLIWDGDDAPDSVVLEDFDFSMRATTGSLLVIDKRVEP
jgi:hypothetical protein